MYNGQSFTGFGETKPLCEWSSDSRCVVSLRRLKIRLLKGGYDLEQAMVRPESEFERMDTERCMKNDRARVNRSYDDDE